MTDTRDRIREHECPDCERGRIRGEVLDKIIDEVLADWAKMRKGANSRVK